MTGGNDLAPLRLAFVTGTAGGGTARHVAALVAGCRRAGGSARVFGPEQSRPLAGPPGRFMPVPIGARPRPARDAAAAAALRRGLRAYRPHVVHAHGVRAGAFAALALLGWRGFREPGAGRAPRRVRPALIVTVHNGPPAGRGGRLVYAILERICAWRCDAVLCAAPDLADRMDRRGARGVRRFDVAAGGPTAPPSAAALAAAAARLDANGRPVVLAVGRLAPQKGFDVLVAAAARWRDRVPAPRTVIAGSGPLAGALAAQARRLGADVMLLGERDDVPALMALADVVAVPSRWEARSLVLQEALLAGRPVVATRAGGTAELTGEEAALLVPPGDAAALARGVLSVLDDQALAARLRQAGRALAASFPTAEDAVREACALYRSLAAGQLPVGSAEPGSTSRGQEKLRGWLS